MIGNIVLVKLSNQRVISAVILRIKNNVQIIASPLRPYKNNDMKNCVYIGQPDGLKFESVAIG